MNADVIQIIAWLCCLIKLPAAKNNNSYVRTVVLYTPAIATPTPASQRFPVLYFPFYDTSQSPRPHTPNGSFVQLQALFTPEERARGLALQAAGADMNQHWVSLQASASTLLARLNSSRALERIGPV